MVLAIVYVLIFVMLSPMIVVPIGAVYGGYVIHRHVSSLPGRVVLVMLGVMMVHTSLPWMAFLQR
jgi:hypothetical protein